MKKLYLNLLLVILVPTLAAQAQVNLTTLNAPHSENFNSLASTGTTHEVTTLPAGWTFLETGTNANTTYAVGTGSSNTGNTYSFGLDEERALGGLQSGSLTPAIGASFVNNTNATITSLQITFQGEQWRLGASARGADRLDFQYSIDATSLNSGSWTHVDELDFSSPVTTGTVGALNGNDAPNKSTVTFTISGLTIASGNTFFIRWLDFNVTNADDGLAIDNFVIIPGGTPDDEPAISFTPAALSFGDVNVGADKILMFEVQGQNLVDSIQVFISGSAISIAVDTAVFTNALTLAPEGGTVFVRFAPNANGAYHDSIHHESGITAKALPLSGAGYDPFSNIISIQEARSKSVGTKVTVAGRITVADELGNPAYVQDASGGIPVFHFPLATTVSIGDSVIVTGPIGVFNEQKQISGNGIFFSVLDTVTRVPEPIAITLPQLAAYEGMLVTVQQVELVNQNFVFYPQSTERITDGTIQADLRIDGDTDIAGLTKSQGLVDITGVVGRFRTNAQLLPRFREDIPGAQEPTTPADSIAKSKTIDVVNWNLEFFGATREQYGEEFGPADEALQLANIRQVLDTLQADVIAVQEVSDVNYLAALVSQLEGYAYACSDRYSHSFDDDGSFPPQRLCYIYDTNTVEVLTLRPLFEDLYDSARTIDPSLLPGYPSGDASSFYSSGRLPYLLTANVTIDGVREKISFINIHAKSGAAAADRARRAYDARVLKDSLDAHFSSEQVIILGDLNDDLDQSITAGQPSPYKIFVDDTAAYHAVSKALSDAGARSTVSFNDVIDHQIITNDLTEEYIPASAQILTPFALIPDYGNTTSDHLPVITRYQLIAPEVSFVQTGAQAGEDSVTIVLDVVLTKPVSEEITLTIALTGTATPGADYTASIPLTGNTLALTVPAGGTQASFTLTTSDDVLDELDELAVLTLQPSAGIKNGENASFTLTITDNDIPRLFFTERYAEAAEGADPYAVRLQLSTPVASEQNASILIYGLPGVVYGQDYTTNPAPVGNTINITIPAGSDYAEFTISALADSKRELPLEMLTMLLTRTSPGLVAAAPRLSFFAIRDVRTASVAFTVSPNPTAGRITILANGKHDAAVHAELRNDQGELIFRGHGKAELLSEHISAKLISSRRGLYTLQIFSQGEVFIHRLSRE